MGEVVRFRIAGKDGAEAGAAAPQASARILFFTGVRYQRHEEPIAALPELSADEPPSGGWKGAGGGRRKRRG